jgi:hypothetical protein
VTAAGQMHKWLKDFKLAMDDAGGTLLVTVSQDKRTIGSISIPVGSVSDAGTQVQWFKVKSAEVNSQAPLSLAPGSLKAKYTAGLGWVPPAQPGCTHRAQASSTHVSDSCLRPACLLGLLSHPSSRFVSCAVCVGCRARGAGSRETVVARSHAQWPGSRAQRSRLTRALSDDVAGATVAGEPSRCGCQRR